jgi:hypothetical protein
MRSDQLCRKIDLETLQRNFRQWTTKTYIVTTTVLANDSEPAMPLAPGGNL